MKIIKWFLVAVVVVAVLAGVVVTSGLVPAKASSGHWPLTAWGLEFAMERSVATGSLNIKAPPLDDEALVMRGAGHFNIGCAWCHGIPGASPSRFVLQMTPHPSVLDEELNKWTAEELFYIVRHGVKFTGMPAWPAAKRDDEVWAVVAFLKNYTSLSPEAYERLAGIDQQRLARQQQLQGLSIPEVAIDRCVSCHASDGQGRHAFPSLAGQKAAYLEQTLQSYRSGQRPSGTMGPIAAELTDEQITELVAYFASQPARQQSIELTADETKIGESLVATGDTKKRVGACYACHPLSTRGAASEVAAAYPSLVGQRADYLVGQLHLFREKLRGGGPRHHLMHNIAEELTDEQIRAVARFYATR